MPTATKVEYAGERKIRARNKVHYRISHWPIWIAVFFLAPGPLIFDLFAHGFDRRMGMWLGAVLLATGIAGIARQAAGRRAASVYHPVHRRQTESRLPPHLLHVRVERRS